MAGPGTLLSLARGEAEVIGRGGGVELRAGALRPIGGALVVFAGALGTGVGLATGAELGLGVGRGAGPRTIGFSVSTGPCERGSLVGRAPGIE